jgi:hypothetical protein
VNGFYVLNSLVWSVVGAGVGYRYGAMTRDINNMKRRLRMNETPGVEPIEESTPTEGRHRFSLHRPNVQQFIGAAVVIMAVISVITVTGYARRLNSVSSCLTNYVTAYNNVLRDRDNFAEQSRTNLRDYIQSDTVLWKAFLANVPSVVGQQPTQAQRDASITALQDHFVKSDHSVAALDAVSAARAKFPLPENLCHDANARGR